MFRRMLTQPRKRSRGQQGVEDMEVVGVSNLCSASWVSRVGTNAAHDLDGRLRDGGLSTPPVTQFVSNIAYIISAFS